MRKILWFCLLFTAVLAGASHQISIPEVVGSPVLDGEDEDVCWQNAAVVFGLVDSKTQALAEEATVMRLVKSEETLFGYVYCEQKGAEKQTKPMGSVELFFTNGSSVFQFILDHANGVFEQELLPDAGLGTRPGEPFDSGIRVCSKVRADNWMVEFALPLKSLQLKDDSFGLNLVRNNRGAQVGAPQRQQVRHVLR